MTAITMITTVEHADRGPRSKDEIAASVAADIPTVSYVTSASAADDGRELPDPGVEGDLAHRERHAQHGPTGGGRRDRSGLDQCWQIPVIELRGRVEIDLQRIED